MTTLSPPRATPETPALPGTEPGSEYPTEPTTVVSRADRFAGSRSPNRPASTVRLTPRGRRVIGATPAVLLVLGWLLLTVGNHWFVNPDGVVYASLATRIAHGDLAGAVTGYWSPLLPTLAAPFTLVGVPALFALRLVLLVAALVALPVVRSLCRQACGSGPVALFCTLLAVPLLLVASVFGLYPELLLAVALLIFCRLVLISSIHPFGQAVKAGVAGGVAYLAKPVGLPFVVGFVLIVLAARLVAAYAARGSSWDPAGDRSALRRFHLIVLLVTALVAAPWVIAISVHVGHPTWSTSGSFNAQLVTPGAWGNPLSFPGLHRPVPPAITPWENPSLLSVSHTATHLGQPVTVLDRVGNAVRQAEIAVGSLLRRWTPVLLVALLGLVSTLRRTGLFRPPTGLRNATPDSAVRPDPIVARRIVLGGVLAAVLFAAGMSLIVVVERYLWFPMLALLPAAAVGLRTLATWWSGTYRWASLRRRFPRGRLEAGLAALLVVVVSASLAPVALTHWNQDREVWSLASRLEASSPSGCGLTGGLAGDRDWERSQLLAYLCGVDYLGLTGPDQRPSAQADQLKAIGGRHLVVWDDSSGHVLDLSGNPWRQHTAR